MGNYMKGDVHHHGNYTIDDMKQLAIARGGECKSSEYRGLFAPLEWQCNAQGHLFRMAPQALVYTTNFCPRCAQKRRVQDRKLTLQDAQVAAAEKEGKCLSNIYVNNHNPLSWECCHGHQWETSLSSVKQGRWCPACANIKRGKTRLSHTIDEMRAVAKSRGGECLSEIYPQSREKLHWRCKEGHEWHALSAKILARQWCPTCSQESRKSKVTRLSIDDARAIAKERKGSCLSIVYINTSEKLRWQCEHEHDIFEMSLGAVKKGSWCPRCGRLKAAVNKRVDKKKWTLDAIVALVKNKNGSCEPIGQFQSAGKTRFSFTCSQDHHWETTAASVINGSWCPECGKESSRQARLAANIADLQAVAGIFGGKCISTDKGNSSDIVWWQCAHGHVWQSKVAYALDNNWCPACAGTPFTIINNGMVVTDRYSIITQARMNEIKDVLDSSTGSIEERIAVINRHFMNDLSSVVKYHLKLDSRNLLCLAQRPIEELADLLPKEPPADLASLKDPETAKKIIKHVASQLVEIEGRQVDHVISHLIVHAIQKIVRVKDIQAVQMEVSSILNQGKTKIEYIHAGPLFITQDLYAQVHDLVIANPDMPEKTLVKRMKRFTMEQLTPIINIARGIPVRCSVVIAAVKYLEDLPTVKAVPRLAAWRAINRDYVKDLFRVRDEIRPIVTEITGKEIMPAIHSWLISKTEGVDSRVLADWLEGRRVPPEYDAFTSEDAEDLAWILGSMLSESKIFASGEGTRIAVPDSNPLMFLEFLIPQTRHPSYMGKEKILSPDLVEYLKVRGGLDDVCRRSPISLTNHDLFLAGFFDAHLVVANRPFILHVMTPFNNFQPWLNTIPFKAPVALITSNAVEIAGSKHDIQDVFPNQSPSNHAIIYLLGRKFSSSKDRIDANSLHQVAFNIKYVFERIFPLCIHPRLDTVLEVGMYTDEHYGRSKYSSDYAFALSNVLREMGGIDLGPLKKTVNSPIRKPGTTDVLVYLPAWLKDLLKRKGWSADDILAAFTRRGEFFMNKDERITPDVEGDMLDNNDA
jgi:hypothetical protein